jgi:hypothetical protein
VIGEKIAQFIIEPIDDDGLMFHVHGEHRLMHRAYRGILIETAVFDLAAVIVEDIEADGYDVTDGQRGMIAMAIAAWKATHQEKRA